MSHCRSLRASLWSRLKYHLCRRMDWQEIYLSNPHRVVLSVFNDHSTFLFEWNKTIVIGLFATTFFLRKREKGIKILFWMSIDFPFRQKFTSFGKYAFSQGAELGGKIDTTVITLIYYDLALNSCQATSWDDGKSPVTYLSGAWLRVKHRIVVFTLWERKKEKRNDLLCDN